MKTRIPLTKKDAFVVLGCIAFLWTNLAVISTTGRHRAKDFVCRSNLQQWAAVFAMYAADNDGGFTPGWYTGPTGTVQPGERWFDAMKPYFDDNNDLVCCPTAVTPRLIIVDGKLVSTGASGKFSAWGKFLGPGSYPVSLRGSYGSYGINIFICNPPAGSTIGAGNSFIYKGLNQQNANQIPVLFDSMWIDAYPFTSNQPPMFDGDFSSGGLKNCCIDRHSAAVNIFFLDFSVRRIGLKQLWELPWHTEWWATYQTPTQWNDPNHWMYNMKDYAAN